MIDHGHNTDFCFQCLQAAKAVVENMINGLAPTGYMRFAPDGEYISAIQP